MIFACGFHKLFRISQICEIRCKVVWFWISFEQHINLAIFLWNPKQQRMSQKIPILRIPQQFCFRPIAESTYSSQNAKFGLVIISFIGNNEFQIHGLTLQTPPSSWRLVKKQPHCFRNYCFCFCSIMFQA